MFVNKNYAHMLCLYQYAYVQYINNMYCTHPHTRLDTHAHMTAMSEYVCRYELYTHAVSVLICIHIIYKQ